MSIRDIIDEVPNDEDQYGNDAGYAPAVRVHIVGSDIDKEEGTEYASFQTYKLVGTESQPTRILAQDLKRKRAVIQVNNGFTDNNTSGYVLIGDVGAVSNHQGALLTAGNQVVLENGRALYLMPDGSHALTVTVIDERYK